MRIQVKKVKMNYYKYLKMMIIKILLKWKLNGFSKYTDEKGTIQEGEFEEGKSNRQGKIIKIKENNNNRSINFSGGVCLTIGAGWGFGKVEIT